MNRIFCASPLRRRTWRELAAAEAGRRRQVVEAWRDPLRMRSDEELPWRLSELQYLGEHGYFLIRVLNTAETHRQMNTRVWIKSISKEI